MKPTLRRLKKVQHAVAGNIAMGVVAMIAGTIQGTAWMLWAGCALGALATVVLIAVKLVEPVYEGEVLKLVAQQPQLPDVRAHVQRTYELPKAV